MDNNWLTDIFANIKETITGIPEQFQKRVDDLKRAAQAFNATFERLQAKKDIAYKRAADRQSFDSLFNEGVKLREQVRQITMQIDDLIRKGKLFFDGDEKSQGMGFLQLAPLAYTMITLMVGMITALRAWQAKAELEIRRLEVQAAKDAGANPDQLTRILHGDTIGTIAKDATIFIAIGAMALLFWPQIKKKIGIK